MELKLHNYYIHVITFATCILKLMLYVHIVIVNFLKLHVRTLLSVIAVHFLTIKTMTYDFYTIMILYTCRILKLTTGCF